MSLPVGIAAQISDLEEQFDKTLGLYWAGKDAEVLANRLRDLRSRMHVLKAKYQLEMVALQEQRRAAREAI